MDEVRIVPAGTITAHVDPRPVRLPQDQQRRVDAHWRGAVRETPNLTRGLVYTVCKVEGDASALRVLLRPTDFAHYLYTQRAEPAGVDACRILHAAGLIVTSDGWLVFGEMGAKTAHPGRLQCAAGGLDARDVNADGAVDLDGSLRREVREEIGLDLDAAGLVHSWQRWLLKSGGPSSSLVVVYGIMMRVRADELLALYRRHAQALAHHGIQPEFARLVRLRADQAAVEDFLATDPRPRVDYLEAVLRAAAEQARAAAAPEREETDPDDVRAELAALGIPDVRDVERVAGGSLAGEVFRVRAARAEYAARVYAKGLDAAREAEEAVLSAALRAGLAVPRVRAAGRLHGRALLLTDWCPGRTVMEELLQRPAAARKIGRLFGGAQAGLNGVRAPDSVPPVAGGSLPAGDRLLHLDFHPLNVLTDGRRITGIIDWENVRAGDPRADLARTISILAVEATRAGHLGTFAPAVLRAFVRGLLVGYTEMAGERPAGMAPFYAWAGGFMERDLAAKAGAVTLRRAARWTRFWRRRAAGGGE